MVGNDLQQREVGYGFGAGTCKFPSFAVGRPLLAGNSKPAPRTADHSSPLDLRRVHPAFPPQRAGGGSVLERDPGGGTAANPTEVAGSGCLGSRAPAGLAPIPRPARLFGPKDPPRVP